MAKALVLTAVTGLQRGKQHTLLGRTNSVGSSSSNDLVLHDRQLDARHAEIRQMLDRWFIVPLSAAGGISVNGIIVNAQARLNQGDHLTLGSVTYAVAIEEYAEREVGATEPPAGAGPRLGDYFIRHGLMSQDQVRHTLQRQNELQHRGQNRHFGQVAYELGYVDRFQLDRALSDQRSDYNDRFRD